MFKIKLYYFFSYKPYSIWQTRCYFSFHTWLSPEIVDKITFMVYRFYENLFFNNMTRVNPTLQTTLQRRDIRIPHILQAICN